MKEKNRTQVKGFTEDGNTHQEEQLRNEEEIFVGRKYGCVI